MDDQQKSLNLVDILIIHLYACLSVHTVMLGDIHGLHTSTYIGRRQRKKSSGLQVQGSSDI